MGTGIRNVDPQFGPFGTGKPVGFGRRRWPWWLNGLAAAVILILVWAAVAARGGLDHAFTERQPPKIQILKPPAGIGLDPVQMLIKLTDADSGSAKAVVRAEQLGKVTTIVEKNYGPETSDDIIR